MNVDVRERAGKVKDLFHTGAMVAFSTGDFTVVGFASPATVKVTRGLLCGRND